MGNKFERKLDNLEKIQRVTSRLGIGFIIVASTIGNLPEVIFITGGATALNSGIEFLYKGRK
ncbi:MAG: hypothetical protein A3H50_00830 [Candidatus Levybacteria bacterium RIFCSPLOWO2_02_FULL_37_10]|nr:MAG: hypothetical protein A2860_04150 [Candidatus Levybacteria bacterium RIFCSPHIGHO2_01_FULL_37_33]OGH29770.1 MAG: hypothetical protein A3F30_04050 [Candidatus Levybacteria bacterium RIFCSPHIGHO2_12_FULL_37_12]OGH43184.1 MAG: hypothetical protein A3H50_00830 [Candidatus Levybacteria bacterium RIFCSPLOWO2_02_FULL_37_10]